MNAFKRKSLYLAIVAGLGAVGVAGSAGAVTLSQTGTGEVLIYPYYTVRNGLETYISVANTTASAKAVKVRFLEGKNSREVLDFNLYLSAHDMWTGAVVTTATGARLATTDTSCTGLPTGGADFVNYAYGYTNTEQASGFIPDPTLGLTGDFEDQTLDRTREGYFEMIEMGEIAGGSTLETAITHVSGVPANCAVVTGLVGAGGQATLGGVAQLLQPTGGLIGGASLMNVAAGTDESFDPVALSAFSAVPIWDVPGSIHPDMTNVNPTSSTVFKGGAVLTDAWARGLAGSTADAVSAVLMHESVMNDFVLDTATLSGTDWVMTMPTKRHYIGVDGAPTAAGSNPITPFTSRFYTGGACEAFTLNYYNREEGAIAGATPTVSPLPPGASTSSLCWESTVLTFNNSNLLGSANSVNQTIDAAYQNGWVKVTFPVATNNMSQANTFGGLPVVGFMVQDFVNGNVGGVLSNYGGSFIHKYTTNINGVTAE